MKTWGSVTDTGTSAGTGNTANEQACAPISLLVIILNAKCSYNHQEGLINRKS